MGPLNNQDNQMKARLLHSLFPAEIPLFISYVQDLAGAVLAHPEAIRKYWKNRNFTVELWIDTASKVQERLTRCGPNLVTRGDLFSELLFDGLLAAFCIHGLFQYVSQGRHCDLKFREAVALLFCSD